MLKDPKIRSLVSRAQQTWTQVVDFFDPPTLRRMLDEIYRSERWADASDSDTEGNVHDPANARLSSARREGNARRPAKRATLRLENPTIHFNKGLLNGTAIFVLVIPTQYGEFDSPTPIQVRIGSPKADTKGASVKGTARAAHGTIGANFTVRLHYDPMDAVKAAVAIARDKGIERETVEWLLSRISLDLSSFVWVLGLPTWARLSTRSLLPSGRPLLGSKDRLLPAQIGTIPKSSLLLVGTIPIPKGVFFDTIAPAAGAHYSNFGQRSGFSLTAGLMAKPNLSQLGKDRGKLVSFFGYADLYYVKRVSDSVDLGFGLTYAVDPFSGKSEPGPAQLHHLESKHKPWLPTSGENVPPSEDRAGHRILFKITGTHDIFGG